MARRIDIGIDGGGTGCRVAISVDGGAVTETRGGSANIVTDPAGAEAAIREALMAALAEHGLTLDDMASARVCAGLAGARLPGTADAFATRLPFLAYVVDDSVTALEGALGGATARSPASAPGPSSSASRPRARAMSAAGDSTSATKAPPPGSAAAPCRWPSRRRWPPARPTRWPRR
jgi:hypothetical protein